MREVACQLRDFVRTWGCPVSIDQRIVEFRESLGIEEAAEMARRAGIPYSTYLRYESPGASPKMVHLARLIEMGCDAKWLLTGERSTAVAAPEPVESRSGFAEAPGASYEVDDTLFLRVSNIVEASYREGGSRLTPSQLVAISVKKYNNLIRTKRSPAEYEAMLSMLEQELRDQAKAELADKVANPTTSKRLA